MFGWVRLRGHADVNPPLARLGGFRAELHACFTRRADALFELGDALVCTQTPLPSLPHLRLEPVCRRGQGSAYAALARGRIDAERLGDLLVGSLPDTDQTAAGQIRTLVGRLDADASSGRVPLFVLDGGDDSAQLTLDLADAPAAVLVRLRADRCCRAPAASRGSGCRSPAPWPAGAATDSQSAA